MPYGLEKELDTSKNNSFMEKCVKRVMEKNPSFDKGKAVAVCKATLKRVKSNLETKNTK